MGSVVNLSVVVPAFNEELIIEDSLRSIRNELDLSNLNYEVIVVNDGSTDGTRIKLFAFSQTWSQLKILNLVSNRGHMAAITAGLDNSIGEYVCTIDADLQDPVYAITGMYRKAIESGVDVVYGVRVDRSSDSVFKRLSASLYYKVVNKFVGFKINHHSADCRIISRRVVNSLNQINENQRVYRLLVPWLGYKSDTFEYPRHQRKAGETHYKFTNMVGLAIHSITSFTAAPLRIATWCGIAGVTVLLIGTVYVSIGWLTGNVSPGWSSIMFAVLFLGSMQLISLGILGEYIAKIFTEVQGRPIYEIDTKIKTDFAEETTNRNFLDG